MNGPKGMWYIDGIDIWLNFAVAISNGLAKFLPLTRRKDSISHDWPAQHGLDVDVSKHFFSERTVTMNCFLITETESEFWTKRNAFIQQLAKPGFRRLTVTAHGGRSYFVIFQEVSEYVQRKNLKNIPANKVVHEFSITVMEPSPQLDYTDTFIASDNGEFLIV
jgi:hypothetical protein